MMLLAKNHQNLQNQPMFYGVIQKIKVACFFEIRCTCKYTVQDKIYRETAHQQYTTLSIPPITNHIQLIINDVSNY